MRAKHKDTWGNYRIEWGGLTKKSIEDAIRLQQEASKHLFVSQQDQSAIEDACKARLYQTRKNWQQWQRKANTRR